MKPIISLSIICLLLLGCIYLFFYTDTIVYQASRIYPLDKNHTYIIKKNDGNEQIPSGVVYVIIPSDNPNTHIDFGTSGEVIGSTDINLEPFLNKNKSSHLPSYYASNKMAMIHITSLTDALY